jgi:hypothetical protein
MLKSVPRLVFISVRNGLIAGLLGVFFMIALYYMGRHPFLFPIYFDFRLILFSVFMVVGLKELRDYHQQGLLSFGEGMISNLLFTIVFALTVSGLIWIFMTLVPAFLADYISLVTIQMNELSSQVIEQLGKVEFERNLSSLSGTNRSDLVLDYLIKSFIISFFISIIISVVLRRQPKTN